MIHRHRSIFDAFPLSNILLLLLSAVSAFTALVLNLTVITTPLIREGPPHLDGVFPLWFILVITSSLLFAIAVGRWPTEAVKPASTAQYAAASAWPAWAVLLLSIAATLIFLLRPRVFYILKTEDHVVEIFSAAVAFAGGGVFLRTAWVLGWHRGGGPTMVAGALGLMAVLFLLGLEEVSWFQRVFDVATPSWMEGNQKSETNIHNYATNAMENAYYFGAFAFLIAAPFIQDRTGLLNRWAPVAFFVPSRNILFTAATASAWNYDMWNIIFCQISFWTTFFVLVWYAWKLPAAGGGTLAWALLVAYVLAQFVFIARGAEFVRMSDVSEYKELFIPLAFLVYAVETLKRARNLVSAARTL